jgi:hypothetical protein
VLVVLEHVQRFQRDAGVAEAHREGHLLLHHQVLGHLPTALGRALVVARDELHLPPQEAADLVDLVGREFCAQPGAVSEVGRTAAGRADEADAQRASALGGRDGGRQRDEDARACAQADGQVPHESRSSHHHLRRVAATVAARGLKQP